MSTIIARILVVKDNNSEAKKRTIVGMHKFIKAIMQNNKYRFVVFVLPWIVFFYFFYNYHTDDEVRFVFFF